MTDSLTSDMAPAQITREAKGSDRPIGKRICSLEPHLFVYGTLMTAAASARIGKAIRARLHKEAVSLGSATMPGRLYDLGRYPGMVMAAAADEVVHGEVFRLDDPADALAWLDAYEGVKPNERTNEYERAVRIARLASGVDVAAWVYLYRGELVRHLPEGRWQSRPSPGWKRS
jgi:gamma-glutamylcyclotransferase (GGCT)/AIG2-like uncharacterized protein YtfP